MAGSPKGLTGLRWIALESIRCNAWLRNRFFEAEPGGINNGPFAISTLQPGL
jgi:hypothetical protein